MPVRSASRRCREGFTQDCPGCRRSARWKEPTHQQPRPQLKLLRDPPLFTAPQNSLRHRAINTQSFQETGMQVGKSNNVDLAVVQLPHQAPRTIRMMDPERGPITKDIGYLYIVLQHGSGCCVCGGQIPLNLFFFCSLRSGGRRRWHLRTLNMFRAEHFHSHGTVDVAPRPLCHPGSTHDCHVALCSYLVLAFQNMPRSFASPGSANYIWT